MKKKRIVLVAVTVLLGLTIFVTALFGLSFTHDSYACYKCKILGKSKALRIFRVPIWKQRIQVSWSFTGNQCDNEWQWYFANSKGILFNQENWSGPIGNYPFAEEMEATISENEPAGPEPTRNVD